ncbi:hypothetical protein SPRG_10983 [Saprolegnia parasitica CBS 223.65]|uniref:SCP domain-containing protein n=1 Tax=Saprolegnia parasitica (strain CBS 223.65) TaxID=695850 RepID=A0A067BWP1_SAPPC|nr:hypothetical protein SPRG_10983 [Saprolegnia parasitica CBS 223.65]KDO22668.1 hypothetical protein SPRG_10983 [Saprolegnia parasitica CBS 223.65]|eukprot:XP_012206585.1 hypothetical protein SPRG_10983 [Saprolegnia parasitica CBS 223.65]
MKSSFFLLALATSATASPWSEWGDQDLWVLTTLWPAQACATQYNTSALCASPTDFMKSHLVAASLVPSYNSGRAQTGMCRYEYGTFLEANINAVGQGLLRDYWPHFDAPSVDTMWTGAFDKGTPEYEYTCSGMHQGPYLEKVVNMTKDFCTPSAIRSHIGSGVATPSLRDAFGGNAVLHCDGKHLARVVTCWAKHTPSATETDPTYEPTTRMACPSAIARSDSCIDAETLIAPFPPVYN